MAGRPQIGAIFTREPGCKAVAGVWHLSPICMGERERERDPLHPRVASSLAEAWLQIPVPPFQSRDWDPQPPERPQHKGAVYTEVGPTQPVLLGPVHCVCTMKYSSQPSQSTRRQAPVTIRDLPVSFGRHHPQQVQAVFC